MKAIFNNVKIDKMIKTGGCPYLFYLFPRKLPKKLEFFNI